MAVPLQRLGDVLTRVDELLVMLLKVEQEQLKLLQRIAVPVPPVVPIPPDIREKIMEMHERGVSLTQIATELRIDVIAVREVVERIVVIPPGVTEVVLRPETITDLAAELASRLLQLPDRLKVMKVDTSITNWKSLRAEKKIKPAKALGFWVEDIGGGFEYQLVRMGFESDEKTAQVDDKWDQEFDDLLVKGSGVAGTAKIWYWWRV